MVSTLETVLEASQNKYGLQVNDFNKRKYMKFLQEQIKAHPNYNLNFRGSNSSINPYPYFNCMVDKLLLFSYLIGQTPILAGNKQNPELKRILSIADLYLLRYNEIGGSHGNYKRAIENRTDERLYHLFCRINNRNHQHVKLGFQNWRGIIDELGQNIIVIMHFSRTINYKLVLDCHSPNPLNLDHGGYRWDGSRKENSSIVQSVV